MLSRHTAHVRGKYKIYDSCEPKGFVFFFYVYWTASFAKKCENCSRENEFARFMTLPYNPCFFYIWHLITIEQSFWLADFSENSERAGRRAASVHLHHRLCLCLHYHYWAGLTAELNQCLHRAICHWHMQNAKMCNGKGKWKTLSCDNPLAGYLAATQVPTIYLWCWAFSLKSHTISN